MINLPSNTSVFLDPEPFWNALQFGVPHGVVVQYDDRPVEVEGFLSYSRPDPDTLRSIAKTLREGEALAFTGLADPDVLQEVASLCHERGVFVLALWNFGNARMRISPPSPDDVPLAELMEEWESLIEDLDIHEGRYFLGSVEGRVHLFVPGLDPDALEALTPGWRWVCKDARAVDWHIDMCLI